MKTTFPKFTILPVLMGLFLVSFAIRANDLPVADQGTGTDLSAAALGLSGWQRKQAITIDHDLVVGSADLIDFPFLVTLDHLNGEIVDGGPNSALNGGGDLRFTSDVDGNHRLAIEVVEFVTGAVPANRKCQVWVKIPTLSAASNTTIYVWYNRAGEVQPIATDPYGSRAVWANYYFVSHDGLFDSATGQALAVAGSPTVGTAPYGGRSWKGNGTTDFTYINGNGIDLGGGLSISLWKKNTAFPTDLGASLAVWNDTGWFAIRSHGTIESNAARTWFGSEVSSVNDSEGGRFYPNGDQFGWHHFSISQTTPVGEDELVRGDGAPSTWPPSVGYSWNRPVASGYITIGNTSPNGNFWLGAELAELRISETVISAGFSDTGYNNQSDPMAFATAGTPMDAGGSGDPGTGSGLWALNGADIYYGTGNVGIGTTDPGTWKLAVDGKIRAREVKVETANWPDYVFADDYRLPTLEEVERHITEKGHLINMPSALDVGMNGIELGEMNRLLLEKIEELTLYILKQEKRLKYLEETVSTTGWMSRKINSKILDEAASPLPKIMYKGTLSTAIGTADLYNLNPFQQCLE